MRLSITKKCLTISRFWEYLTYLSRGTVAKVQGRWQSLLLCVFIALTAFDGVAQNNFPRYQALLEATEAFEYDSTFNTLSLGEMHFLVGIASAYKNSTDSARHLNAEVALEKVAEVLELQIREGHLSSSDAEVTALRAELEKHQYLISVRPSDVEKIVHYAQEGRFDYILKRFFDRNYHIYASPALLFVVWFSFIALRRFKRKRNSVF